MRTADRARARSAPVFAALGDDTRLRLVLTLSSGGPASITSLTDGSGVTRQAVTKHLNVLSDAGLVRSSWQGRERLWEFEPKRVEEARRYLDEIALQWDAALERLRAHVEAPRALPQRRRTRRRS